MKKLFWIIGLLLCISLFSSCAEDGAADDDFGGTGEFRSVAQDIFPEAPPQMTVVCGEEQITAWRGTYSWHISLDNGMGRGKQADSMHPLSDLDRVPVIAVRDGMDVTLAFDVPPSTVVPVNSLEVRRYRIDTENYDDYETVSVEGTTLTLTEDDALYEVIASWDVSDGAYRGTARYAFRTTEK